MKKLIIALLILISVATGCTGAKIPELLEPVGVSLDTAVAEKKDIYDLTVYSGEIVPYVEELSFTTDGHLGEMKVTLGDTVKKGQVLASLEAESIYEAIEELTEELEYIRTMGEYDDRQKELDIAIAEEELVMLRENGASQERREAKEKELKKLELELEQAQELRNLEIGYKTEQLDKLEKQAHGIQIKAPFAGRVVYIADIKEGDAVNGYKTVLCIADEQRLSISADMIARRDIEEADRVYARIMDQDYKVTYIPYGDQEYISRVLSGETLRSRFAIDQNTEGLESGQFAAILLMTSYRENALSVPVNAVYRDEKGRYVYKVVDGQRLRCDVSIGVVTEMDAEITNGLQEGDIVYVKE